MSISSNYEVGSELDWYEDDHDEPDYDEMEKAYFLGDCVRMIQKYGLVEIMKMILADWDRFQAEERDRFNSMMERYRETE